MHVSSVALEGGGGGGGGVGERRRRDRRILFDVKYLSALYS